MALEFPTETKKQALESIKRFFTEEMENDIGDLKANTVLCFFLEELAPSVYNRAVSDAQGRVMESVGDLDGSCHEPEFGFWNERKR